jgi:tetratricopeptide (TPR) repeat protein
MVMAQFADSVSANVNYWQRRVHRAGDQKFRALDSNHENLLRAIQFGLALPETQEETCKLISHSFTFVERRGYWREWLPVLNQAVKLLEGGNLLLRYRLLDQLGHLYRLDWQLSAALEAHQAAEALALEAEDDREVAHIRFNLSEDYRCARQYEAAERFGLAALELFTALGQANPQVAATLNTLGLVSQARGHFVTAEERLAEAVARFRRTHQPIDLARALKNLAMTLEALGKVEAALRCYIEAATLLEGTGSELDKVLVDLSLGTLYFNQGQWAEAEATFRRADSPYLRQSGYIYYRALATNNLGNVLLARGRLGEAEAYLLGSLRLWRQTTDEVMLANTLGTLGETFVRQAQPASARPVYDESLELLARHLDDAFALRLHTKFSAQRGHLKTNTDGSLSTSFV